MKKILGFGVTAALIALLVGCTQANDNKTNTTPINYKTTIDLPESLTAKKGASGSVISQGVLGTGTYGTSYAYANVQNAMDTVKSNAVNNAEYGILLNEVIRQNNLSTSGATKKG